MNTRPVSGDSRLFALTLFLSAGLLFLVQPMFGKMVLPRFGGAPAVWNTCQVFFQTALLAGYLYAHFISTRLSLRWQVGLHAGILLLPLVSLPVAVASGWEPAGEASPVPALLGLLAVSVGLPFVVISATAPLLQAWFARSGHPSSSDPYFLYAASNAGSLLALLAYPLLLEPALPLSTHRWVWSGGYLLLAFLILSCGARVWRRGAEDHLPLRSAPSSSSGSSGRVTGTTFLVRLRWLALAFVPSSLMLSVTLHLTTDVAAVPLLWVLPLAIYLATFVLVFARRQFVPLALTARIMPLVVLGLVLVLISEATEPVWLLMIVHLGAFFIMALVCHGELARLRPPPEQLTEFYLWLSVGGILGGMFSALLAPLVFSTMVEYPLMLVAACLLRPPPSHETSSDHRLSERKRIRKAAAVPAESNQPSAGTLFSWIPAWQLDLLLPIALGLIAAGLIWFSLSAGLADAEALAVGFALPAVLCYLFLYRPARFALGIGALLLASQLRPSSLGQTLYRERSFFGVHRVTVDPEGRYMQLVHGNTVHGKQRLAPVSGSPVSPGLPTLGPAEPLNYYHRRGPAGDIFSLSQVADDRLPIAVVGLGTGSLAAYAQPGQELDFYEIDPVVQRIAENGRYFTFLRECRGQYRILLGDARLKLGEAADDRYGLIVLDAFSSDAVPLHLITRQAVELYVRKLANRGIVALHVSNRYLNLPPVLSKLAGELDLVCLVRKDLRIPVEELREGRDFSVWVVLARRPEDVKTLADGSLWVTVPESSGDAWTDERANLFSAWGGVNLSP